MIARVSDHPDWDIFNAMLYRCNNPRSKKYPRYGGRGITVCGRWLRGGFRVFVADMGPRPSPKHSLDRIDNDGPYSPENCRWATMTQQQRNTMRNRLLAFQGQTMPMSEWAERLGMNPKVLRNRLTRGWSVDRALSTPMSRRTGTP